MSESSATGAVKRAKSSAEIISQFNAANAKILAVLIVLGLLIFHSVLRLWNGSDTCQWLTTDGRYRDSSTWQPYGCMMHTYSQPDVGKCLQHTGHLTGETAHVAFVGDSRIRQLYFELLKRLDPKAEPSIIGSDGRARTAEESRPLEKAHTSLTYSNTPLSLRATFYWHPVFNQSTVDLLRELGGGRDVPRLLVAGSGAWDIKLSNGSQLALDTYGSNLVQIARVVDDWPEDHCRLLWKPQDPVDADKLSPHRKMITNDLLDAYNGVAKEVLKRSRFRIWDSARLLAENADAQSDDGIHLNPLPLKHNIQMILNIYCNEWMDFDDGTCCRSSENATTLQIITLTFLLLCLDVTITWLAYRSFRTRRSKKFRGQQSIESQIEVEEPSLSNGHPTSNGKLKQENGGHQVEKPDRPASTATPPGWQVAVSALGKLGLVMAYFYLCDRTNFFMKENKYYSTLSFWIPVAYVFALGIFFNEDSRSTRVLHRDQTDEWKGWMQLVILIYHMTGASRVIGLYMQMRILVSSYLFLTGYGHLCFFWNGGSASFTRLCQVLFRLNLMTVVICLCMNRPYQSYYFVPLVTFSYLYVYAVLAMPPKVSALICEAKPVAYLYITLKFVGLFAGITILYMSEVFFNKIFLLRPWKALFVTRDDEIHEWWFRWSLDRYSICFGMVFGFVYLNAQKYGLIDDSTARHLLGSARKLTVAVFVALSGLAGYTAFTVTCHSKPECNEIHSYLAFIPIVSFIVLRNVFGPLRQRYSTFFAWFGRISLELFIGQYHIWLAADTHGILVVIPNYPMLNVCVTTYILVCVAHEVHTITGQLVGLAVPSDWKRALRNVVLFFLALVLIAVHDGQF